MEITIEELRQTLHKIDLQLRPWVVFVNPKDVKAIKEAHPRIEEKVVIQETEAVEIGRAIVIKREELEVWAYGNDN